MKNTHCPNRGEEGAPTVQPRALDVRQEKTFQEWRLWLAIDLNSPICWKTTWVRALHTAFLCLLQDIWTEGGFLVLPGIPGVAAGLAAGVAAVTRLPGVSPAQRTDIQVWTFSPGTRLICAYARGAQKRRHVYFNFSISRFPLNILTKMPPIFFYWDNFQKYFR